MEQEARVGIAPEGYASAYLNGGDKPFAGRWGPAATSIDHALEWAGELSDRVVVTLAAKGDQEWSAGAESIDELPEWPPDSFVPGPWPREIRESADCWRAEASAWIGQDPTVHAAALAAELPAGHVKDPRAARGVCVAFDVPGGRRLDAQRAAEELVEGAWKRMVAAVGPPAGFDLPSVDLSALEGLRQDGPKVALIESFEELGRPPMWTLHMRDRVHATPGEPINTSYATCHDWARTHADVVLARRQLCPYVHAEPPGPDGSLPPALAEGAPPTADEIAYLEHHDPPVAWKVTLAAAGVASLGDDYVERLRGAGFAARCAPAGENLCELVNVEASATAVAAVAADAVDQVSKAFAEAMPRDRSMWIIQVVDWEAA
jgi:hypothetical protein